MKNLLMVVLAIAVSLSVVGCKKKPTCEKTTQYSQAVAKQLAGALDCKNPEAIAGDIQGEIEKLKLCEVTPTGPIAVLVCKPVSILLVQMAVNSLPKKWECSGGATAKVTEQLIYAACSAAPF